MPAVLQLRDANQGASLQAFIFFSAGLVMFPGQGITYYKPSHSVSLRDYFPDEDK